LFTEKCKEFLLWLEVIHLKPM